ncbi:MAG: phosphate acyltransferase PlsX [Lautropia sp.]|nr:phosphate acyltransferase PlsX [Lautropia sp.]
MSVRLAIDAMGGDHGLAVTVPAALSFLQSHADAELLLVGRPDEVEQALREQASRLGDAAPLQARIRVVPASEVIRMDDNPVQALRNRRDSSMRVAIEQVKAGAADACVSAGNTGALMAISRFVLKTLPGIDRPAIATQLPTQKGGYTTMLDLGANVDCEPVHLLQFAIMGSALSAVLDERERPAVGLLNIGEELIKGNDVVKEAARLIRETPLNFIGNIEGNDVYAGKADVVVCDGFVGNVALKTSEGVAQMIGAFMRQEFSRNALTRLAALCAAPVLRRFKARVDHRRYNGACLIGLRGIVLKSHGSADAFAYDHALRRAYDAARHGLLERITAAMAAVEPARPVAQVPAAPVEGENQPA